MLKNTFKSGVTPGDTRRIGTHPQLAWTLLAQLLECGEFGGSAIHDQNAPQIPLRKEANRDKKAWSPMEIKQMALWQEWDDKRLKEITEEEQKQRIAALFAKG